MRQGEFAKHIGKKPGYVTQLKSAGRLVMQGALVDVEASLKLIAETADPSKAGVAERHAREREQAQTPPPAQPPATTPDELSGRAGSAYQQARAMREKYSAMTAKIDYEKAVGQLLQTDEVRFAVADGDTVICNRIESMFYALAPQLADERDENKILAAMLDQWELIRADLSRTFNEMVKV